MNNIFAYFKVADLTAVNPLLNFYVIKLPRALVDFKVDFILYE